MPDFDPLLRLRISLALIIGSVSLELLSLSNVNLGTLELLSLNITERC